MTDITVRVRYFNVLATYAGTRRAEVRAPEGITVRAFLHHLAEINPAAFSRTMMRGDSLTAYLRVFQNDRLLASHALDGPINDGDELMLFPAVAGG